MKKSDSLIIKTLYALLCIITMGSCIHTYPDEDGIDPTLVQIGADVTVDLSWNTNEIDLDRDDDALSSRGYDDFSSHSDYRLIIVFMRNNELWGRCEHYLTHEEYLKGTIKLIMPFEFHAVSYDVFAWLDCVDSESHQYPSYDASSLSNISPMVNHISWNDDRECACCRTSVNLGDYKDQWNARVVVPLKLTTPLARFNIVAKDMPEFNEYIEKYIKKGEKYSLCVSFESRIATNFNLIDNNLTNFLESAEFYFPFSLKENNIASCALFAGDRPTQLSARILVYNSARIIISKSPTFQFSVKRGCITTITGNFLTNYCTNNINVDNIWDGEIIIEI